MTSATLLLSLASLLQFPAPGTAGNSNWREFRPKEGGYHVQMPGDATKQKPLASPGGVPKLDKLDGIYRNGIGYLAGHAEVPAAKLAKGPDAWLDDSKGRFVKLNKAKVVDERTIKTDDYPGRELTVEYSLKSSGARQVSKVRMYLVKERYYFLQVLASKRHGLPDAADEFLDSFALNDSPNAKAPPGGLAQGGIRGRGNIAAPGGAAVPGGPLGGPPVMTRGARGQSAPPTGGANGSPPVVRGGRGRPGAPAAKAAEPPANPPPTTAGGPNATPPLKMRGIKGRLPAANSPAASSPAASTPAASPEPADTPGEAISWKTYTSKDGRFEVKFPGEPTENKQKAKGPAGETDVNVVFAQSGPSQLFAVLYLDAPNPSKARDLVEGKFDPNMASVAMPDGGKLKVVDDKKKTVDGHPTRTLLLEPTETKPGQPTSTIESRIVVVEKRVYMLFSVRPRGEPRPKEVDEFLDSFKVTSRS